MQLAALQSRLAAAALVRILASPSKSAVVASAVVFCRWHKLAAAAVALSTGSLDAEVSDELNVWNEWNDGGGEGR